MIRMTIEAPSPYQLPHHWLHFTHFTSSTRILIPSSSEQRTIVSSHHHQSITMYQDYSSPLSSPAYSSPDRNVTITENRNVTITETYSPSHNRRLFTVDFFGTHIDVTVTASASVVKKWIGTATFLRRHLLHRLVVGVGVQWSPSNGNDPPAETLQLCIGRRCLIFQLYHADTAPRLLRRFLLNTCYTFVGLWTSQDQKKLVNCKHVLSMHNLLDLRRYVVDGDGESLAGASEGTIIDECLGYRGVSLDRDVSMSDWDEYRLSHDQVLQACIDAYASFEIGKNIRAWEL